MRNRMGKIPVYSDEVIFGLIRTTLVLPERFPGDHFTCWRLKSGDPSTLPEQGLPSPVETEGHPAGNGLARLDEYVLLMCSSWGGKKKCLTRRAECRRGEALCSHFFYRAGYSLYRSGDFIS